MENDTFKVGKVVIKMKKPDRKGLPQITPLKNVDKISEVDVGKGIKEKFDFKTDDIFENVTPVEKQKKNNKKDKVQPKVLKKISQKK